MLPLGAKEMTDKIDEARTKAGRNYQRALELSKMRPADLAEQLGLKSQSIANWRHRGVSTKYAQAVADLLGAKAEKISVMPDLEAMLSKRASTVHEKQTAPYMEYVMAGAGDDGLPDPPRKPPRRTKEQLLRLLLDTPLTADDVDMLYALIERLNAR